MARLTDRAIDFIRAVMNRSTEDRKEAAQPLGHKLTKDNQSASLFGLMGERGVEEATRVDQDLIAKTLDYEMMDQYPELGGALTVFADNATQPDMVSGRTVSVDADDQEVKDALEQCFYNNLDIDNHVWEQARSLCKYGNDMSELLVTDRGVIGLEYMAVPSVRRVETRDQGLVGFVQDPTGQFRIAPEQIGELVRGRSPEELEEISKQLPDGCVLFDSWQVVHMRLRNVYRSARYGSSVLENARWIWKRLTLLEDAMMLYKITRSPARYAFYVDVGTRAPRAAVAYMNEVKKQLKKKKYVNEKTGQLDLRHKSLGMEDDFFVPIINGQDAARIEVLAGPNYQATDDVVYFLNKMYAAIQVPKMYLGFAEDRNASAILSNVDVQFARSVLRIQRELKNGMRKIARVHLSALGLDPAYAFFDVFFTIPSGVYEIAQMEIRRSRAELASAMREFVSNEWVLKEIFGFTDTEIQTVKSQRAAEEGGGVEASLGAAGGGETAGDQSAPSGQIGAPENPFGESFGSEIRREQREFMRMTKRDLTTLKKKTVELLQEDKALRSKLQEVDFLLRELRTLSAPILRNGNGRTSNGTAHPGRRNGILTS